MVRLGDDVLLPVTAPDASGEPLHTIWGGGDAAAGPRLRRRVGTRPHPADTRLRPRLRPGRRRRSLRRACRSCSPRTTPSCSRRWRWKDAASRGCPSRSSRTNSARGSSCRRVADVVARADRSAAVSAECRNDADGGGVVAGGRRRRGRGRRRAGNAARHTSRPAALIRGVRCAAHARASVRNELACGAGKLKIRAGRKRSVRREKPPNVRCAQSVARILDQPVGQRPPLRHPTFDHGAGLTSLALDDWAWRRGVQFDAIRSGNPVDEPAVRGVQRPSGRRISESARARVADACAMLSRRFGGTTSISAAPWFAAPTDARECARNARQLHRRSAGSELTRYAGNFTSRDPGNRNPRQRRRGLRLRRCVLAPVWQAAAQKKYSCESDPEQCQRRRFGNDEW